MKRPTVDLSAIFVYRCFDMARFSLFLKRNFFKGFIASVKAGAFFVKILGGILAVIFSPVRHLLKALFHFVGVPAYRAAFLLRRAVEKTQPRTSFRASRLISGRVSVHIFMFVVVAITSTTNFFSSSVRAEDAGQKSALYKWVSGQEEKTTIVIRSDMEKGKPVRYLGIAALVSQADIDFHSPEDDYVGLMTGSGAIIAPLIAEGAPSVAPRTDVVAYKVETGDTLGGIANKFGISVATLLNSNQLSVRSTIRPGDTLQILPVDGVTHKVKSGDTVLALAKKYQADAKKIVEFNRLANSADLRIGEVLIVPGGIPPAAAPKPRTLANAFKTTQQKLPSNIGSVVGSGRMGWPTDLRVITQYFGWKHTGLDVDCHFTNNNYAADDGIVQFSGWKGGYGLTVEVNHGNGIVTRYGHHAKLFVSNGQSVSRGTPLGVCGTTGRSTGTHLHFEVITGGKFRNPLEYLR